MTKIVLDKLDEYDEMKERISILEESLQDAEEDLLVRNVQLTLALEALSTNRELQATIDSLRPSKYEQYLPIVEDRIYGG